MAPRAGWAEITRGARESLPVLSDSAPWPCFPDNTVNMGSVNPFANIHSPGKCVFPSQQAQSYPMHCELAVPSPVEPVAGGRGSSPSSGWFLLQDTCLRKPIPFLIKTECRQGVDRCLCSHLQQKNHQSHKECVTFDGKHLHMRRNVKLPRRIVDRKSQRRTDGGSCREEFWTS